jgi:hypothetical protein
VYPVPCDRQIDSRDLILPSNGSPSIWLLNSDQFNRTIQTYHSLHQPLFEESTAAINRHWLQLVLYQSTFTCLLQTISHDVEVAGAERVSIVFPHPSHMAALLLLQLIN